jgi:ribosomal protein S18 acetylase RimI-like enzyme
MKIRLIIEKDIRNCAQLFSHVFSTEPWNEPWTEESAFKRLNHFFESKGFVGILIESNNLIGFALGTVEPFHFGDMFYLREMCIDTRLQSSGHGYKLLEGLEESLKNMNVDSIYLTTDIEIPASKFYQKHGFNFKETMGFYAKRINS